MQEITLFQWWMFYNVLDVLYFPTFNVSKFFCPTFCAPMTQSTVNFQWKWTVSTSHTPIPTRSLLLVAAAEKISANGDLWVDFILAVLPLAIITILSNTDLCVFLSRRKVVTSQAASPRPKGLWGFSTSLMRNYFISYVSHYACHLTRHFSDAGNTCVSDAGGCNSFSLLFVTSLVA